MVPDDDHTAQPKRIVKPRTRKYKRMPIVVIDSRSWINENGETGPSEELLGILPDWEPTLFVTIGAGDFAAWLDATYSVTHAKAWQWRVTTQEKGIHHPGDAVRVASRVTTVVHYFGFKLHRSRYHRIIDPVVMYGKSLDDVWPGDSPMAVKLMRWGQAVRDFCDENGLEVRPTIGSIGSQFLTDPRFYPEARRKVPRAINDRARENLPGNYYGLMVQPSPDREFTAWYVDQRRAPHYHARTTDLPDANSLYAHGRFLDLGMDVSNPNPFQWDGVTDDFYGLYCLRLDPPEVAHHSMWHWIESDKPYHFVFSNEVPLLVSMGYRIRGVLAAWGSHQIDGGIKQYASWAETQLDEFRDAPWVKPLLLATYGTLATRPSFGETIFKLASRGQAATTYTGRRKLTGIQTRKPMKLEPGIANVIHRGMIEAATRVESIELAQLVAASGFRALSIYADAVIVQQPTDNRQLPDLPEPWRIKTTLNHLQFINKQAFMSGEMTKLPGVSRERLKYRQHSPGTAPKRKRWDNFGRRTKTDRRI